MSVINRLYVVLITENPIFDTLSVQRPGTIVISSKRGSPLRGTTLDGLVGSWNKTVGLTGSYESVATPVAPRQSRPRLQEDL